MRWIASLMLSSCCLATPIWAQSFRYDWIGDDFTSASGTVTTGQSVSGFLVLEGPVENLPFGEVSPVRFSFTAGPVTIDDGTPLHSLTRIRLATDANGDVTQTEIQLVEEVDLSGVGGGLLAADTICVSSCPAGGAVDLVIDRDEATGGVLGEGEVPVGISFWTAPVELAPAIPLLPAAGLAALTLMLAAGARSVLQRR